MMLKVTVQYLWMGVLQNSAFLPLFPGIALARNFSLFC